MVPNGLTNMNTRTAVPDDTLGPYDENQLSTYAAAAINVADYQRTFTIGDGRTSTLNGMQFVNSPLRANQAYVFFIRLYSSEPVSYMYNEEVVREVGREEGGGRVGEREGGNGGGKEERREWEEGREGGIKERRKRGWLKGREGGGNIKKLNLNYHKLKFCKDKFLQI